MSGLTGPGLQACLFNETQNSGSVNWRRTGFC